MPQIKFTVPGDPCPKPRQTQSDKWRHRPAVDRYRLWADLCRLAARKYRLPDSPTGLESIVRISLPRSWPQKKRQLYDRQPHRQKPDLDNFLKAQMDSLFTDDSGIYHVKCHKYWTLNAEGETEITIYYD